MTRSHRSVQYLSSPSHSFDISWNSTRRAARTTLSYFQFPFLQSFSQWSSIGLCSYHFHGYLSRPSLSFRFISPVSYWHHTLPHGGLSCLLALIPTKSVLCGAPHRIKSASCLDGRYAGRWIIYGPFCTTNLFPSFNSLHRHASHAL